MFPLSLFLKSRPFDRFIVMFIILSIPVQVTVRYFILIRYPTKWILSFAHPVPLGDVVFVSMV